MPVLKDHARLFSTGIFDELTDIRCSDPDRVISVAKRRKRPNAARNTRVRPLRPSGFKMNIIAADHPARRVVHAGTDPHAMMNRRDLLSRIARILIADAADGVMATMDVLEELLLLHDLAEQNHGKPFLHNKYLIGSMNRGGLQGTVWELDDPVTSMTPDGCREWNLDGSKLLLRICDDDPNSLKTIQYCSESITALNPLGLPIILEPLPVVRTPAGHYRVAKNAEELSKIVGVASALGDSSRNLWLKLPHCPEFQVVASSTTLPILLLGGSETMEPKTFISQLRDGLASGNNVRGTMIGRNVLYPADGDPVKAALRVHEIVHEVQ